MKFSAVNVIEKEKQLISSKSKNKKVMDRIIKFVLYKNPTYHFCFAVPTYTFIRAKAFCEDFEIRINEDFTVSDLAKVLFEDFLAYLRNTNNVDAIFKRLQARDLSPAILRKGDESELIFEENRGYKLISTTLTHKEALRGEFILRDMLDVYKDHSFTLENILEIIFRDFIDDYRRGYINDPFSKIEKYI